MQRRKSVENKEKAESYADILYLQHPVSKLHTPMPLCDRAAQFAPFAALVGHDSAIQETARLTDAEILLAEDAKNQLDEQFQMVQKAVRTDAVFSFTYFMPDARKDGGEYVKAQGQIKKINKLEGLVLLQDGTEIPMNAVIEIHSISEKVL